MENNSFDELFENGHGLIAEESFPVIETFFEENLPMFIHADKYFRAGTAYFSIYYCFKDLTVTIGSGRAFIEYEMKVQGEIIDLAAFEPLITNAVSASKKNFLFVLNVMKRFFETRYHGCQEV